MKRTNTLLLIISIFGFLSCKTTGEMTSKPLDIIFAESVVFGDDLLKNIQETKKIIESNHFTAKNCPILMNKLYEILYNVRPQDLAIEKLRQEAEQIIYQTFLTRLSLKERVKGFIAADQDNLTPCLNGMRRIVVASRTMEDVIGNWYLHPPRPIHGKAQTEFTGSGSYLLKNPRFADFKTDELLSGDVLMTKGNAFASSAIAKIGAIDSQFSHVSMVYRDESNQLWTIESHIETGVVVRPIAQHLNDGNIRSVVFRHGNSQLAHKAAKYVFDKSKNRTDNIPYDFMSNLEDHDEVYCSELIYEGYAAASHNTLKVPYQKTEFPNQRYFIDLMGWSSNDMFAPQDIEFDPRFELVAEWRDFAFVSENLKKDVILKSMYEWIENRDYRFRASLGTNGYAKLAWQIRKWNFLSLIAGIKDKLPPNMPESVIKTILLLDRVGQILFEKLSAADDAYQQKTGFSMTFKQMTDWLEEYRRQDKNRFLDYQNSTIFNKELNPEFHHLFNANP